MILQPFFIVLGNTFRLIGSHITDKLSQAFFPDIFQILIFILPGQQIHSLAEHRFLSFQPADIHHIRLLCLRSLETDVQVTVPCFLQIHGNGKTDLTVSFCLDLTFFFHVRPAASGNGTFHRDTILILYQYLICTSLIQHPAIHHQCRFAQDLFPVDPVFHQAVCTEISYFFRRCLPDLLLFFSVCYKNLQIPVFSCQIQRLGDLHSEACICDPCKFREISGHVCSVETERLRNGNIFIYISIPLQDKAAWFLLCACSPACKDQSMCIFIVIFLFIHTPKYFRHSYTLLILLYVRTFYIYISQIFFTCL